MHFKWTDSPAIHSTHLTAHARDESNAERGGGGGRSALAHVLCSVIIDALPTAGRQRCSAPMPARCMGRGERELRPSSVSGRRFADGPSTSVVSLRSPYADTPPCQGATINLRLWITPISCRVCCACLSVEPKGNDGHGCWLQSYRRSRAVHWPRLKDRVGFGPFLTQLCSCCENLQAKTRAQVLLHF